jgi:hypothetical protein
MATRYRKASSNPLRDEKPTAKHVFVMSSPVIRRRFAASMRVRRRYWCGVWPKRRRKRTLNILHDDAAVDGGSPRTCEDCSRSSRPPKPKARSWHLLHSAPCSPDANQVGFLGRLRPRKRHGYALPWRCTLRTDFHCTSRLNSDPQISK